MKDVKVKKRARPHYKKEQIARKKGKQTRKSGKGYSLMHAAAKKQNKSMAAKSDQAPEYPEVGRPPVNRADAELVRLMKRGGE